MHYGLLVLTGVTPGNAGNSTPAHFRCWRAFRFIGYLEQAVQSQEFLAVPREKAFWPRKANNRSRQKQELKYLDRRGGMSLKDHKYSIDN